MIQQHREHGDRTQALDILADPVHHGIEASIGMWR
jgi:hypothetical protein